MNEVFSIIRLFGLILIVASLIVSVTDIKNLEMKTIPIYLVSFFLNGAISVINKFHQISSQYAPVSTNAFIVWGSLVSCIFSSIMLLFFIRIKKDKKQNISEELKYKAFLNVTPIIFLITCVGGVASYLQLKGAQTLPASVLYPLVTGGCIVLSSLAGVIFFKEKLSGRNALGVLICLAGTCLFL